MKEKVGIGLIGTGFARKVQVPAFQACEGAFIASIASGHLDNARAAAEECGATHFTDDWRETIARDDVDLVCITTPPVMHREMTLAALKASKHVLCEKPMAMNTVEAEEMATAAEKAAVIAIIDHELRFLPGRLKARDLIQSEALGKIRHVKTIFRSPYRADPSVPYNWWADKASGGGALGAINSHIIDSLYWLLETSIDSVFCGLHTNVKQRPDSSGKLYEVTSDDEANMMLHFADSAATDDATGLVSVSMAEGPDYLHRMEFYGEGGALRLEHDGQLFVAKRGETDWSAVDVAQDARLPGMPDTGFAHAFQYFAPHIVDTIRAGKSEVAGAATFADGLAVQRVLDAARRSDAERREITI